MVGTAFTERDRAAARPTGPPGWPTSATGVVLGTDFPNIPYAYAEQLAAIGGWADADDRLGEAFLRLCCTTRRAALLGLRMIAGAPGVMTGRRLPESPAGEGGDWFRLRIV